MRLCSACLLGAKCRFDGRAKPNDKVMGLAESEALIPVCPEQRGGLPTPRERAERNGDRVVTKSGRDVTAEFAAGAEQALHLAQSLGIRQAILKQKSPSCGCGLIYDGTFSGKLIKGDGVTAALLKKNGVEVITEADL